MTPVLWFMVGIWLGGAMGFLVAALFRAAAEADARDEALHHCEEVVQAIEAANKAKEKVK